MKSIKIISNELNISSRTLRYYEEIGLINSSKINKQRFYDDSEISKIVTIINLRKINLSLSEIKELLNSFNEETFNEVLKEKIKNYQHNILKNTKELYVLNQVQKMVNSGMIINDALNENLNKVINQDEIRVAITEKFIKYVKEDKLDLVKTLMEDKMDITKLSSLIDLIKSLDNSCKYGYQILNYLNYFNNHILLKLVLDKNYIIRFVFDYQNVIIGIWLDAINY